MPDLLSSLSSNTRSYSGTVKTHPVLNHCVWHNDSIATYGMLPSGKVCLWERRMSRVSESYCNGREVSVMWSIRLQGVGGWGGWREFHLW